MSLFRCFLHRFGYGFFNDPVSTWRMIFQIIRIQYTDPECFRKEFPIVITVLITHAVITGNGFPLFFRQFMPCIAAGISERTVVVDVIKKMTDLLEEDLFKDRLIPFIRTIAGREFRFDIFPGSIFAEFLGEIVVPVL